MMRNTYRALFTLLLMCLPAIGANVRFAFTNYLGVADTNWFLVYPINDVADAGGSFITKGPATRLTPASNGHVTNAFEVGNYLVTNRFLNRGFVMRVPNDHGPTVYCGTCPQTVTATNLAISGLNSFVTIYYGTNPPPTYDEITNSLGFLPVRGVAAGTNVTTTTNNGVVTVSATFGAGNITNFGVTASGGATVATNGVVYTVDTSRLLLTNDTRVFDISNRLSRVGLGTLFASNIGPHSLGFPITITNLQVTAFNQAFAVSTADGVVQLRQNVNETGIRFTEAAGSGSGITNLNAENLASGLVPTARLGLGTANASTFLRGDQTYAPVSGVGGEGWDLVGNAALGDTNFLGTLDGAQLVLIQSNTVVGRFKVEDGGKAQSVVLGTANTNRGAGGTISGGKWNVISTWQPYSTIGGGRANLINGPTNTLFDPDGGGSVINGVGGGNVINGGYSNTIAPIAGGTLIGNGTIGGGAFNRIYDDGADGLTIGGGIANTIGTSPGATIGGGNLNLMTNAYFAAIGGGVQNSAVGTSFLDQGMTVAGGSQNVASKAYATVPGGNQNVASGSNAFAAGFKATAAHAGSFVWSDVSSGSAYSSTANNQFSVRAAGGVRMDTGGAAISTDGIFSGNGIGLTNLPFSTNAIYVAKNGNNANRGTYTEPKLTLSNAVASAVAGQTVIVAPGDYNENNLLKNGVNWHFESGAYLYYFATSNNAWALFDDRSASGSVTSRISGHLNFFYSTGTNNYGFNIGASNALGALVLTNPASDVEFEFDTGDGESWLTDSPDGSFLIAAYNGAWTAVKFDRLVSRKVGQSFGGTPNTLGGIIWQLGEMYIKGHYLGPFDNYGLWPDEPLVGSHTANLWADFDIVEGYVYGDAHSPTYKVWMNVKELRGTNNVDGIQWLSTGANGAAKMYLHVDKISTHSGYVVANFGEMWLNSQKLTANQTASGLIYNAGVLHATVQHFEDFSTNITPRIHNDGGSMELFGGRGVLRTNSAGVLHTAHSTGTNYMLLNGVYLDARASTKPAVVLMHTNATIDGGNFLAASTTNAIASYDAATNAFSLMPSKPFAFIGRTNYVQMPLTTSGFTPTQYVNQVLHHFTANMTAGILTNQVPGYYRITGNVQLGSDGANTQTASLCIATNGVVYRPLQSGDFQELLVTVDLEAYGVFAGLSVDAVVPLPAGTRIELKIIAGGNILPFVGRTSLIVQQL